MDNERERDRLQTFWLVIGVLVGATAVAAALLRRNDLQALLRVSGPEDEPGEWTSESGKVEPKTKPGDKVWDDFGTSGSSGVQDAAAARRKAAARKASTGKSPDSSCPADRPIKVSRSGIYYTPGQNGYERTTPAECFSNATEAEVAGYRPRK